MTRILRHYVPTSFLLLLLADVAVLLCSFPLGNLLRYLPSYPDLPDDAYSLHSAVIFTVVMLVSCTGMGVYQRVQEGGEAGAVLRLVYALASGFAAMSLVFYAFPGFFVGRGVFGWALASSLTLMLVSRLLFSKLGNRDELRRRVLVLGAGEAAKIVRDFEVSGRNRSFRIVGFVPSQGEVCRVDAALICTPDKRLHDFIIGEQIDEVVVAPDDRRGGIAPQHILECKTRGIDVYDLQSFLEREGSLISLHSLRPSWLMYSDGFQHGPMQRFGKRAVDVVFSIALLLLAWPFMLIIVAAILIESGGPAPVFYRQVRVGLNGREFSLIKFRSMRTDAEVAGKAIWASENDNRITRVGRFIRKTRLDEFPQIFNVLMGDMSFVGPRPERPVFVDEFSANIPWYAFRHCVKPGITGWAQLCYPYGAGIDDAVQKLQYDLYYVKNYSIMLDFLIFLQTIEVVLWGKGAR